MRIDVNAFIGHYPFRRLEGGSPALILAAMGRVAIDEAWISNLPAVFWRDPTEGNGALYRIAESHPTLRPVPAVHPGLANWSVVLSEAIERHAPAVRLDPTFYGVNPTSSEVGAVLTRCGELGLPIAMAVRLEDGRQRHPVDGAAELSPWAVRQMIRADQRVKLIVTHADREFVEQVHFGATPRESARILWDICWIWGPPNDDLTHLVKAVGADRFAFGTGMPLRIPESSAAKLDLTECTVVERQAIDSGNARRFEAA